MPRDINATFISLIPKSQSCSSFVDFRPISLCNLMYKFIAKILANRIKLVIGMLIAPNQSAFIKGRLIEDNILICHDIVRGMERKSCSPVAILKVDLHKAYDSLNREYLFRVMEGMGFPSKFIQWIRSCINTPMFSILVNGSPAGYFRGEKGIRQGDPLSSFLFSLAMEPLSQLLDRAVSRKEVMIPHKCKGLHLSHLMFADDLMIFTKAETKSVTAALKVLDNFSSLSDLKANRSKSVVIIGGTSERIKRSLIECSNFREGSLPIKYLGLPLVASRISHNDCSPMIDKVFSRIESWKHRFLSAAGRLQLISSVLQSSIFYWTGIIGLPAKSINIIESAFAKFLWAGKTTEKKIHFASWAKICLPRAEGGLGIRRIKDIIKAALIKKLWNIIVNKESLWVNWIKKMYLQNDSIWSANSSKNHPTLWRSILQSRDIMKEKVIYKIKSGEDISFWLDPWLDRDILWDKVKESGFILPPADRMAKVSSYLENGRWRNCPFPEIHVMRSIWEALPTIITSNNRGKDYVGWKKNNSIISHCSLKDAWNMVRSRKPEVDWHKAVWFSKNIPRHSFTVWRGCLNALATSDQLAIRNINVSSECSLCRSGQDSIVHLFFQCQFSAFIRNQCLSRCIPYPPSSVGIEGDLSWLHRYSSNLGSYSPIPLLVYNAVVYHTWKERNSRIFGEKAKSKEMIVELILKEQARKILSMSFHSPRNTLATFISQSWSIDVH